MVECRPWTVNTEVDVSLFTPSPEIRSFRRWSFPTKLFADRGWITLALVGGRLELVEAPAPGVDALDEVVVHERQ